jgi:hypothetical protein
MVITETMVISFRYVFLVEEKFSAPDAAWGLGESEASLWSRQESRAQSLESGDCPSSGNSKTMLPAAG